MDDTGDKKTSYKYVAFISYKSEDEKWARWLQRRMESYKLPTTIQRQLNTKEKKIGRCFIYHNDIRLDTLRDELNRNLEKSQWLIVICSKAAAHSPWVGNEVETFAKMHLKNRVLAFIVNGVPYSNDEEECYPEPLRTLFPHTSDPHTTRELLGANVNEKGNSCKLQKKERALIQILATIIGVEFDSLWDRHKWWIIKKTATTATLTIALCALFVWTLVSNQPFDATMRIQLENSNETLGAAKDVNIDVAIGEDNRHLQLENTNKQLILYNIPAKEKGKPVHVKALCQGCINVDTNVIMNKFILLILKRDTLTYGHINIGLAYDYHNKLRNETVLLEGKEMKTNNEGRLITNIPIKEQKKTYTLEYEGKEYQIPMPHHPGEYITIKK